MKKGQKWKRGGCCHSQDDCGDLDQVLIVEM